MKTFGDLIEDARPVKTDAMAKKWWNSHIRRLTTENNPERGLPTTKEKAAQILKFQVEVIAPRLSQRTRECLVRHIEKNLLS